MTFRGASNNNFDKKSAFVMSYITKSENFDLEVFFILQWKILFGFSGQTRLDWLLPEIENLGGRYA